MKHSYQKTALVDAEQYIAGGPVPEYAYVDARGQVWLETLEGWHIVRDGDYICTGIDGEHWNVDKSIFERTHQYVQSNLAPVPSNPFVDEPAGFFRKFVVTRADGSSEPGCKHSACEYFVLDLMHDQFAIGALSAYAESCKVLFPELADDLQIKIGLMLQRFNTDAAKDCDVGGQ